MVFMSDEMALTSIAGLAGALAAGAEGDLRLAIQLPAAAPAAATVKTR
ncbi:hypothetical protein MasN3_14330 [Massilia varians]|uniref:Uncharacterized protein n=1 Tax=Massilia varians TaxID=457921 RepID=A0ABN6T6P0_9BURK|nr:hypothetical protein MasN3_14330 [Massilia varians]